MSDDIFDIDLSGVDTSEAGQGGGWSALPKGEYRVMITSAEVKDTRSGTGKRLALELTVMSQDDLNGKRHWEGLNIINPNKTAEQIAHEHLAMLADAAELPRDFLRTRGIKSLVGKIVLAEIVRTKAKGDQSDYADKDGYENSVRTYAPTGAGAQDASPQNQSTQSTPDAAPPADDIPF